jgi:TonB-dependent starch-binding outer membrane protein SusC
MKQATILFLSLCFLSFDFVLANPIIFRMAPTDLTLTPTGFKILSGLKENVSDAEVTRMVFADSIKVVGIVRSETEGPLAFASIQVLGTTRGTQTDLDGRFSITAERGATLVFSYTGYEKQELPAQNTTMTVTLQPTTATLQQVVVVGYGTARKQDVTGASVQVKGSEIVNNPLMAATQALQGRAAGVQIINSGAPGSAPSVRIRGAGSILGGADPLYVVDGIITTDIRNINNADILTIDVLKDASSTAIYGARAANGVVLITTKSGGSGKPIITYDAQVRVRLLAHQIEMSPPGYYAEYSNAAAEFPVVTAGEVTGKTNWYEKITRPALSHRNNLSMSGGRAKYQYFASAGYLDEDGILDGNKYRRYTARYNHTWQVLPKLKVGNTIGISQYRSFNKPYGAFTQAYIAAPIFDAVNPDGTYGNISSVINNVGNPYASIKTTDDQSFGHRLQANAFGEYQLTQKISFRSQIGLDRERNNGFAFTPEYYTFQADGLAGAQRNELADLRFERDTIYQWVWDNFLNYETEIGENQNLKLTVGHTAERRDGWKSRAEVQNNNLLVNDQSTWMLNFTDTALGQQNFRDPIGNYFRRESYFARANYRLYDKYLINATVRADANSNFPKSNRWGVFPAVGLGWVVSNEPWMQRNQIFESLKLRTSFGIVGNDVIRPGQFDLRPTERLYAYFGTDRIDGAIVTGIVDPNLKWENVYEYDFGIDFSLLKGALSGELDYYHKTARDALYNISYPAIGFGTSFLTNAADVRNTGVEFSLKYTKISSAHTTHTFGFNATANKNKVLNVGLGRALNFGNLGNGFSATQAIQGQEIGTFWVYQTNGLFQNDQEISDYPHVIGTKPGDLRLVDLNKDGIIDNEDRTHVGSHQPKFFGGLNYQLNWKKWDFGLDLFGNFGNKVYNAKKGLRFGSNYNVELAVAKNRWQAGSNENRNPRASNVTPYPSDYFVESGSFVRINQITIGRNMQVGKARLSTLRAYVSAQNPYLFTKYTGFTPELPGNPTEAGIELNIYPISSAYVIGLVFSGAP